MSASDRTGEASAPGVPPAGDRAGPGGEAAASPPDLAAPERPRPPEFRRTGSARTPPSPASDTPPLAISDDWQRLDASARVLWAISGAGWGFLVLIAASALRQALAEAGGVPQLLIDALTPLSGLLVGFLVLVVPVLRWRRWRYRVREHEIDIQHGTLSIRRTVVPVRRIQHVDTARGVLQQGLGLSTVVFHTAAGGTSIPQLSESRAAAIRARVSELTQPPDEL
jgi:uncharacterized protein